MSEHSTAFVAHLARIAEHDRGALAALRRSVAFDPGAYPPAYPSVERFSGAAVREDDSRRRALYIVAGLFAMHPRHAVGAPIGTATGVLMRRRASESIEGRFIALLAADPENVHQYLRPLISLLAADGIGVDYASLLDDLTIYVNPFADQRRDTVRQRWARDFYRHAAVDGISASNDVINDSAP